MAKPPKPQHQPHQSHAQRAPGGLRSMLLWMFAPARHARMSQPVTTDQRVDSVERDLQRERTERQSESTQLREQLGDARRQLDDIASAPPPAQIEDAAPGRGDDLAY